MDDLTEKILELIRLTSTDLPPDIEKALVAARDREREGSAAQGAMQTILQNVDISRKNSTPVCQDTGTPIFFVSIPMGWGLRSLSGQIREAVAQATRLSYLRPNAVNALTDKNTGNNLGDGHFPAIHIHEVDGESLTIDLILKGGGSENVGAQYSLPDYTLKADRDLDGVRKTVLHAVKKAQGLGCAPGILGVAVGGDRNSGYEASKEVLLRRLDDQNPDPTLADLEKRITDQANQLGIGPMGFGGKTTILGTKIITLHRLPACYFVSISYMCWAYRRRRMMLMGKDVQYL
jgi:fumarate hydratase, class I